jgi:hypothetical protein
VLLAHSLLEPTDDGSDKITRLQFSSGWLLVLACLRRCYVQFSHLHPIGFRGRRVKQINEKGHLVSEVPHYRLKPNLCQLIKLCFFASSTVAAFSTDLFVDVFSLRQKLLGPRGKQTAGRCEMIPARAG